MKKRESYEKGYSFEKEFAKFLKKELGWEKVRLRTQVAGKENIRGANLDIIGEKLSEKGKRYEKIGGGFFVYMIILVILSIISYFTITELNLFVYILAGISLVIAITAYILLEFAKKYNKEHAWVECKNHKTKTDINQVHKMLREIEDFKTSRNTDYRFTEFIFVSASGYVENALKLAVQNKITCYVKKDNSFERVNFWN